MSKREDSWVYDENKAHHHAKINGVDCYVMASAHLYGWYMIFVGDDAFDGFKNLREAKKAAERRVFNR